MDSRLTTFPRRNIQRARNARNVGRFAMSLALVAALTGVCFAGAVAAITIGLNR